MYPRTFEYFRPGSVEEALQLMLDHGDEARVLAGGQSLIPLMKLRLATPSILVDLNGLSGLSYVAPRDGVLAIGALSRHVDVEDSALVRSTLPLVTDAVRMVGDVQVRNLGTVAGALVEADPGGDWGPVLMALGGEVQCIGPEGTRSIDASQFFGDFYTTAVEATEIVTEVRLRLPAPESAGAYLKLERRAGDFAVVGVAVQIELASDGVCREVGIGLSGVAPTPIKPVAAETVLRGTPLDDASITQAVRELEPVIDPWTDARGPAEYKREMAGVFLRRALELARSRASYAREANSAATDR